ncbi:uncharacterized protein BP5553_09171 [Venustampulla echinocandica]|uniref:FAD-binding domain-containing protein n=1 Tax=Venustampulla echinocandica TaxID=2656787 RepID=A0A370TBZ0_9HELO|nr:uncharacterized protein BP5553_09171 [Venustampulla echinocandica]RDL31769.1 hypothetical protein BP5553_09171 [Venustampulla echinocandica]
MADSTKISKVIIVGAGPSGLLLGVLLAKQGIQVQLLEQATILDSNPRAAHHAPNAVQEFRRAGVLNQIAAEGIHPSGVCWREIDGKILAGIKPDPETEGEDKMVCLPLDKLGKILLKEFCAQESAEMNWEHKVVGVEQDEKEARVTVETPEGTKTLSADYIVGCDGANSGVRRALFGDSFPGETLQQQIIATNVYYDFSKFDYWDSQFIVHPENWYMAARITADGMWRVTYGDKWGLSTEEYLKRQPQRYEEILPGSPKPGDYKLVGASPYKLHQRCAESMRVGRFLLAADAGHLCNPFGGMGLTGGFADITSLYDCLIAMHNGLTDDSILDKYSEVRINKWKKIIDPSSRANFLRLWNEDAVPEREAFFAMCDKMATDKAMQDQGKKFYFLLNEDFTPYFKKPLAA